MEGFLPLTPTAFDLVVVVVVFPPEETTAAAAAARATTRRLSAALVGLWVWVFVGVFFVPFLDLPAQEEEVGRRLVVVVFVVVFLVSPLAIFNGGGGGVVVCVCVSVGPLRPETVTCTWRGKRSGEMPPSASLSLDEVEEEEEEEAALVSLEGMVVPVVVAVPAPVLLPSMTGYQ